MVEFLTTTMSTSADKDEQDKDVSVSEQNQEKLKEYVAWFNRDWSIRYTLLSCMHDDLLGEFECYPIAKDMWEWLKLGSVKHPLQGCVPCA